MRLAALLLKVITITITFIFLTICCYFYHSKITSVTYHYYMSLSDYYQICKKMLSCISDITNTQYLVCSKSSDNRRLTNVLFIVSPLFENVA